MKRIKWNNQPPIGEQKMVLPVQTQQNTTPHRNKLFTLFCIANLGNDDPRVSLHHFDQHYLHVIDNDYTISNFEKLGIYYFLLQEPQLSKQHFFMPQYLHRISMLSQRPYYYVPVLRLKPEDLGASKDIIIYLAILI